MANKNLSSQLNKLAILNEDIKIKLVETYNEFIEAIVC